MTINFESDKDVIVYALEKIICYGRKNQYIFVAQSIWWIASVIGLTDGLVMHIDNLRILLEVWPEPSRIEQSPKRKSLSATDQDTLEISESAGRVHRDRISQIDTTVHGRYESENSEPEIDRATLIIREAKRFVQLSRKERNSLKKKPCGLSKTRSGKIPAKPLTKKRKDRLGAIPEATLSKYLESRKQN